MVTDFSSCDGQADDGDPVDGRISRPCRVLRQRRRDRSPHKLNCRPKELQQRTKDLEKGIDPGDDRGARIEQEAAAAGEPGKALLGDPQASAIPGLPAAVAIKPLVFVNEIRRIGDNQVGVAVDAVENVAATVVAGRNVVDRGIDGAERQSAWRLMSASTSSTSSGRIRAA